MPFSDASPGEPAGAAMLRQSFLVPSFLSPKPFTTLPRAGQTKPSPESEGGFALEAPWPRATSCGDIGGAAGITTSPGTRTFWPGRALAGFRPGLAARMSPRPSPWRGAGGEGGSPRGSRSALPVSGGEGRERLAAAQRLDRAVLGRGGGTLGRRRARRDDEELAGVDVVGLGDA